LGAALDWSAGCAIAARGRTIITANANFIFFSLFYGRTAGPFAALGSAAAPFAATIAGWSRLPSAAHDRIFKFNKTSFVLFSASYLRAVRNCGAL
jgi:hypothetical protein